jgi:hypothetical protein
MLSVAPLTSALAESDALLTVASEVSEGILRVVRFDVPDECQSGKQIARLTRSRSSKTTRIVGGAEVAIMFSFNSTKLADIRYEGGGLVSRSAVRAAAAILKFDSVVGEKYELVIHVDQFELNYRLQKSAATAGEKQPVPFREYALASEIQGTLAPTIVKWCVGNRTAPAQETQAPARLNAYQACIARGVPQESCAMNYLSQ